MRTQHVGGHFEFEHDRRDDRPAAAAGVAARAAATAARTPAAAAPARAPRRGHRGGDVDASGTTRRPQTNQPATAATTITPRPAPRAACAAPAADARGTARSSAVISGRRVVVRAASRSTRAISREELVDGRFGIETDGDGVARTNARPKMPPGSRGSRCARAPRARRPKSWCAPRCPRSDTPRASRACFEPMRRDRSMATDTAIRSRLRA